MMMKNTRAIQESVKRRNCVIMKRAKPGNGKRGGAYTAPATRRPAVVSGRPEVGQTFRQLHIRAVSAGTVNG